MAISSTLPTTPRGYLSQSELAQFADITIEDTAEADDQIGQAEELIDSYVGFHRKFFTYDLKGKMTNISGTNFTLELEDQSTYYDGQLVGCQVEIIGGTGVGQRRKISANTYAGVCTVQDAWTTTPDTTSIYHIYQLGKFPRPQDVYFENQNTPYTYYKQIPEAVKRAVAAQVEYFIEMGPTYFSTNKSEITEEEIGDYRYKADSTKVGNMSLIAPKAKILLHGYVNRTGSWV